MVRRDAKEGSSEPEVARCASSEGSKPFPVSAGAPGSRPPSSGRDPDDEAGRRKPLRREQERGPQHEVKPAASTDEQTGSRAAHVTAKATPGAIVPKSASGPGGVRGAARVQGEARNTRDPSARPWSGQVDVYKAKPKSRRVQRESEGIVVPSMVAQNNATGGKGPCGGHADGAGKREGMAGSSGPNDPGGRMPRDKVRELQRRLCAAAKRAPGRRFHASWRTSPLHT